MSQEVEAAYQTFLADVYKEVSAQDTHSQSEIEVFKQTHICHTYGELLYPSLIKLLKTLDYTDEDVFLDLGSGMGKLVLAVFLRTSFKKVIGIEGSDTHHQQAVNIFNKVKSILPDIFTKGTLELIQGNFLDFDFNQASIIYTCSTCFTQELLWMIGEKINQSLNVRQVMSLKPIANLKRLKLKRLTPIECSWDSAICYHYE